MSAFTTVNPAAPAPAAQNGQPSQPSHSPTVSSHPEPDHEMNDDDSILSDPPLHDDPIPVSMQVDGAIEHADHHDGHPDLPDHLDHPDHPDHPENAPEEPNPKKRKRYNDPPQEVHAELRRPQLAGQWYSKTPEQWEELSHLHKLIYSHVGRIEETDLGEEVEPCEACRKRGFKCMKYKQDHPEVEKLYKGNVRVGTSCTRCRRYRRTCALPGKKQNGSITTPNRPQSMSNGYPLPPGTGDSLYKTHGLPERDTLDTWENTLLAAASGGSPLTSVASSPGPDYAEPPSAPLPPPAHPDAQSSYARTELVHHHPNPSYHRDIEDVPGPVHRGGFLDKVNAVELELRDLRAAQSEFNRERRQWHEQKRDLETELYRLREDQRQMREQNWHLQKNILQLEKDALAGKGVDMDRIMAEAELKVENRQLTARVDILNAQHKESKTKLKELKRAKKSLKRKVAELQRGTATSSSGNIGGSSSSGGGGGGNSSGNNGIVVDDSSSSSDSSDTSSSDESSSSIDENTRVYFDDSEGVIGSRDVH